MLECHIPMLMQKAQNFESVIRNPVAVGGATQQ